MAAVVMGVVVVVVLTSGPGRLGPLLLPFPRKGA